MNENLLLCGIDFGKEYISLAYFNYSTNEAEIIDVSGGYGIAALSSCITYIPDYDEWITGEYALKEMSESAVFFKDIVFNAGKGAYYDFCGRQVSNGELLNMLVAEIINQFKNVNPNCRFKRITVTASEEFNEFVINEYISAFENNGVSKDVLAFENNLRCALRYGSNNNEKICVVDVGSSETRFYYNDKGYKIKVFPQLASKNIYYFVYSCFAKYLSEEKEVLTENEKRGFDIFADEHKNIALKNNADEFVNLYYGFCYPPFKKRIPYNEFKKISDAAINDLCTIVKGVNDKSEFILSGGIFEQADFKNAFVKKSGIKCLNKSSKAVFALGAVLFSAEYENVIPKKDIITEEETKLDFDIGIMADKFVALIDCNSYITDKFYEKILLLPDAEGDFELDLYERKKGEKEKIFQKLQVMDFPERKKGTVKIKIAVMITDDNSFICQISDMGFGEFCCKSGYLKTYERNDIF